MAITKDIDGNVVREGSIVRILTIRPSVIARLAPAERDDVLSMKGQEFEVYEVDQFGAAWVKKWWKTGADQSYSHSLALDPKEMRLIR